VKYDPATVTLSLGGQHQHPAGGEEQANGYGLYDVFGKVWEWVAAWYALCSGAVNRIRSGPTSGRARVVRAVQPVSTALRDLDADPSDRVNPKARNTLSELNARTTSAPERLRAIPKKPMTVKDRTPEKPTTPDRVKFLHTQGAQPTWVSL
jgi:Sulfatase-modifying factor enzyme 1